MKNEFDAQVPLIFAGDEYTLRFDWAACAKVETALGKNILIAQGDLPEIATMMVFLEAGTAGKLTTKKMQKACEPLAPVVAKIREAVILSCYPEFMRDEETGADSASSDEAGTGPTAGE